MRNEIIVVGCLLAIVVGTGVVNAALPIRRPDSEAVVEKVRPATDDEKKSGVVLTIQLNDWKEGIPVTKETQVHRQLGKLVPIVEAGEIKVGVKVSVWIDATSGQAVGVLIFP